MVFNKYDFRKEDIGFDRILLGKIIKGNRVDIVKEMR